MSLETEIKKLTQAIEAFTKVFEEANKPVIINEVQQTHSTEVKKDEPVEIVETKEEPKEKVEEKVEEEPKKELKKESKKESEDVPAITLQKVKELTKEKMSAGVDRKKLKDIIVSIKPDASLPDLNDEELEKAYNLMKDL